MTRLLFNDSKNFLCFSSSLVEASSGGAGLYPPCELANDNLRKFCGARPSGELSVVDENVVDAGEGAEPAAGDDSRGSEKWSPARVSTKDGGGGMPLLRLAVGWTLLEPDSERPRIRLRADTRLPGGETVV